MNRTWKQDRLERNDAVFIPARRTRNIFAWIAVLSLFLAGCRGGETPKPYRIGILSGLDAFAVVAEGFKAGMADLGYREGKTVIYDLQRAGNDRSHDQQAIRKFVTDKVDLIFAFPTEPALVAKAMTERSDIPVIFSIATIEGNTLVKNVREPGGNITGVRFPALAITVKVFEILHELMPNLKRLYIAYDPNYPTCLPVLQALRPVVASRRVTLMEFPATTPLEIRRDLEVRAKSANSKIDAILILPELLTQSPDGWAIIKDFAAEHGIPIAGPTAFIAQQEKGAVFTYGIDLLETGRLAAPLADKVLKGLPAGTIPVLSPEAYLRINYRRARELGLRVPEGMLRMATEIIR